MDLSGGGRGGERKREFYYFRGDSKLNLRITAKKSAREGEDLGK